MKIYAPTEQIFEKVFHSGENCVGRLRVGATAFSEMSYMFGILSMTISGELAKVLGLDHGLRPDGKASISQNRHVLRVLVDRLRP